ncbi:hypothetical protein MJL33_30210, partial [Salmonella enterica subsp. enterica serovar Kentucky]|nr:hypothetical protein [Salmonella enterica subsp. enterica serovar Kentucky]
GVNWMGNLREAIRAQSRDVWERKPQDQEKIWLKYLRDFISLIVAFRISVPAPVLVSDWPFQPLLASTSSSTVLTVKLSSASARLK